MARVAAATSRSKRPVWREVEEQEARKLSSRARQARTKQRQGRRLAVVYDIEPPHVRLGLAQKNNVPQIGAVGVRCQSDLKPGLQYTLKVELMH